MTKQQNHLAWDWTPETWHWTPTQGNWSPEYGYPCEPGYLEISTDGIAPHEAYDFWADTVLAACEANRPCRKSATGFRGRVRGLVAESAEFYVYRSGTLSGRRTARQLRADGASDVDIGLVLSGSFRYAQAGDSVITSSRGQFFACDAARPARLGWKAYHGLQITLRRPVLEAALGGPVPAASTLARALSQSRLGLVIESQFALLARHMAGLSGTERSVLLDHTASLTLAALQATLDIGGLSERSRQGLFLAALRHIEQHLDHPALDAGHIARALGCSRATLYRAFTDRGMTIMGAIRVTRLTWARRQLVREPARTTIGDIAAHCGFPDIRTFNRAFRDHFGSSPSEIRSNAVRS